MFNRDIIVLLHYLVEYLAAFTHIVMLIYGYLCHPVQVIALSMSLIVSPFTLVVMILDFIKSTI